MQVVRHSVDVGVVLVASYDMVKALTVVFLNE